MTIMRAPMHLAAGDYIDTGVFLFENRSLGRAKLCVGEIGGRQLAHGNQPVQRLIPARNTVGADDCRCVSGVLHGPDTPQ